MRVNEAVIGGLLLALAVLVFAATASFPRIPGQPYGPDLFPRVICGLLVLAGLMMIARGLLSTPRLPFAELAPWASSPRALFTILLTLGAIVFYILVADTLGFVITAFIMLVVLMLNLHVKPHVALAASTATVLLVEYAFGNLMRIPLPRGLLVVLA